MGKVWEDHVIFKTVAGSQLYGTSTPESDYDVRGVCHQTIESLIGMQPFGQYQDEKQDITIFGLNKFCNLAADCNPNIIEILFSPTSGPTCLLSTVEWEILQAIRPAFLSRKARHTFSGYAFSQLERIERHHRWMVEGPPPDPFPPDYGAVPQADTTDNNAWKWIDPDHKNRYQNAREKYRQWQHWVKERNPARKELEEQWGYDTKHGMHLARLMTQGEELLTTGHITLPRPDAAWLLEIRNGLMTYDEIVTWARDRESNLRVLEENSPLPWGPDRKKIEGTVMGLNQMRLVAEPEWAGWWKI